MIYYRELPEDQKKSEEHEAAIKLLSDGLQEEYGIHTLPVILREEQGKPYFPERSDIHFNYSHTKHIIVCGISKDPIGVDVEEFRPLRPALIKSICHENELSWVTEGESPEERLIMLWTMKEAYVKYYGGSIFTQVKDLNLSPLLATEGNGIYEGKQMQVIRLDHAYISVYSDQYEKLLRLT